jgi:hypothetical protein
MPRLTNGLEQVLTNLGIVGSGYKLFFYETGTTTLKTTYSDEDLTVANTNPIVLNSAGRPNVDVWGSDPSLYRMILGTPDSVVGNITTIVDADPVDNYQINNISGLNPIPTAYWGITEGTSTAYTLEEPLVDISAYSNTQTFFVDIHIACGASPTLKVKDLAAITLKKYMGDGTTTDLVEGDVQIQRYLCINNGTNIVVLNPEKPFFSGENIFQATTSTKGVVELATDAEAQAFTDTEKAIVPSSLSSAIGQIAVFEDQKPSGTDGGTFTSGAWQTRTLNTSVINNITGVSLATNQITLPAGTYQVSGYAVAHDVNQNQTRIQDTTGAATLITGLTTNTTGSSDEGTLSPFQGVFTLSVESDIEVQHRCFSTQATNGFGDAAGFGTNELYCSIMINKIA